MKTKTIAILEIAIVLCSVLLVALPGIAADQTTQKVSASTVTAASEFYEPGPLDVFGNANEDDTIDMRDTTYIKLAIFGKKPKTDLADANYDGKVSMLDVGQTKLIILGKEKKLTLVDAAGRIVTVDKPITKIIAWGQAFHQTIKTLKAEDKFVASDNSIHTIWEDLFPELSKLPNWGESKEMNYELLFELKPDIYLAMVQVPLFSLSAAQQEQISKLEPAGIKTIALAQRHPEELLKTVRKLGYVLDRREEAEEYIDFYEEVMNTITEKTEGLPEKDKPRVYIANSYKYKTSGKGTAYSEYVEMAGGISISADEPSLDGLTYVEIDPEWLVEQNPDVFVFRVNYYTIQGYGQDDWSVAKGVQEDVLNTQELAKVRAIEDERVYLFGQATTAAASFLCIGYMAKWFYPELFADLDMKAMHQEYLDRFQRLDYDVGTQGVFMYPPLYGPART